VPNLKGSFTDSKDGGLSLLRKAMFELLVNVYPVHKGRGRWLNLWSDMFQIKPYGYDKVRFLNGFPMYL
jgi:hypothetical protein